MLYKRNLIYRKEKGFTLIELVIAVAIISIIGTGLAMSVSQVFTINAMSNNREIAIKEVENAANIINRDAQQAQTVNVNGVNYLLKFTWNTWATDHYEVCYIINNNILERQEIINSVQPGTVTIVAENIDSSSAMTNCSWSNGVINVKLTATVGGYKPATETRILQIKPRPYQ